MKIQPRIAKKLMERPKDVSVLLSVKQVVLWFYSIGHLGNIVLSCLKLFIGDENKNDKRFFCFNSPLDLGCAVQHRGSNR